MIAGQLCHLFDFIAGKYCWKTKVFLFAGPEPLLSESAVEEALGHSIMPIFRLIYAQIAGSMAALAKAIHADLHHTNQVALLSNLVAMLLTSSNPDKLAGQRFTS